jgi:hypothetical protein
MFEVGSWFKAPKPFDAGYGATQCKKCNLVIPLTPSAMRDHVEAHIKKNELELT